MTRATITVEAVEAVADALESAEQRNVDIARARLAGDWSKEQQCQTTLRTSS